MTHDELLAKIDNEGEFLVQHFDCKPVFISALRAVVELPLLETTNSEPDARYWWKAGRNAGVLEAKQAIEKELG